MHVRESCEVLCSYFSSYAALRLAQVPVYALFHSCCMRPEVIGVDRELVHCNLCLSEMWNINKFSNIIVIMHSNLLLFVRFYLYVLFNAIKISLIIVIVKLLAQLIVESLTQLLLLMLFVVMNTFIFAMIVFLIRLLVLLQTLCAFCQIVFEKIIEQSCDELRMIDDKLSYSIY